jgi:hypothetical protein
MFDSFDSFDSVLVVYWKYDIVVPRQGLRPFEALAFVLVKILHTLLILHVSYMS